MKQGRKRNRRERKKDNKYEESKLYLIWLRILEFFFYLRDFLRTSIHLTKKGKTKQRESVI
jgi:hypothetical protein